MTGTEGSQLSVLLYKSYRQAMHAMTGMAFRGATVDGLGIRASLLSELQQCWLGWRSWLCKCGTSVGALVDWWVCGGQQTDQQGPEGQRGRGADPRWTGMLMQAIRLLDRGSLTQ